MAERLGSAVAVRSVASSGGRESSVGLNSSVKVFSLNNPGGFFRNVRGGDGSDTVTLFDPRPLSPSQVNSLRETGRRIRIPQSVVENPVVSNEESVAQGAAKPEAVASNILTFPLIPFLVEPSKTNPISKVELPSVGAIVKDGRVEDVRVDSEKRRRIRFEEEQLMSRRIRRRRFAFVKGSQAAVGAEEAAVTQPQVLAESRVVVLNQSPMKNEVQEGSGNDSRTRVLSAVSKRESVVVDRAALEEVWRKRFVGADQEMNSDRQKELNRVLRRLKTEAHQAISGESLIGNSLIRGRVFRSRLLAQTGYQDLVDGSVMGIEDELSAKSDVSVSDIETSIKNNNALVRTSLRPSKLAEMRELIKVYTGDKKISIVPPVPIVENKLETSRTVPIRKSEFQTPINSSLIPMAETSIPASLGQEEQLPVPVNEKIISFPSRLFDTGVHNIRPSRIDDLEERELDLAA